MRHALALARRGLGRVAPNPAVGCILVNDGVIVGRGWTQPGGRPHAETMALAEAGARSVGSTAYVTLEPCAHFGETSPCAQALVEAKVAEIFVAIIDPDERVSGQGIAILQEAGVDVRVGLCEAEARHTNAGFFSKVERGRPWVTLKLATSQDGMIATRSGKVKWVTGEKARQLGHMLRAQSDALITGIGTVLADDPELTCRLPGLEAATPMRVVLDSSARIPSGSKLLGSQGMGPLILMVGSLEGDHFEKMASLLEGNSAIVETDQGDDGRLDAGRALTTLTELFGATRVLAECGAELATSLLRADLVDEVAWFRSNLVLGKDGISALNGLEIAPALAEHGLIRQSSHPVGQDVLETYARAPY